jgi:hypothetical protein
VQSPLRSSIAAEHASEVVLDLCEPSSGSWVAPCQKRDDIVPIGQERIQPLLLVGRKDASLEIRAKVCEECACRSPRRFVFTPQCVQSRRGYIILQRRPLKLMLERGFCCIFVCLRGEHTSPDVERIPTERARHSLLPLLQFLNEFDTGQHGSGVLK